MTERIIQWAVTLTPEEVEVSKLCLGSLARFPGEMAMAASALEAVMQENPDCRTALAPIVAQLREDTKIAHGRSEWLWERVRKGIFHEGKGGIQ